MKKRKVTDRAVEFILTRRPKELKNLKVLDIAEMIGINRAYLSRRFKYDQRISLSNFILREKIYRAIFILKEDGEKSIEELSRELGFMNVEDFDNEFEKHLAISPGKFRDLSKGAN